MTAPLLRVFGESLALKPLEAAYEAWRVHHTTCKTCGALDWYAPGAPRIYYNPPPANEASLYKQMTLPNGKHAWLFSFTEPDLTMLCKEGAAVFQRWQRTSMRYASLTPKPAPDDD